MQAQSLALPKVFNDDDPSAEEESTLATRSSRKAVYLAALLGALAVALFSPSIRYDFVNFDDDLYVYQNPAVLTGLNGRGLEYALSSHDAGTWAPLTWLSYELDTTLLGARPSSYHLTNILLHVGARVLLFCRALHDAQVALDQHSRLGNFPLPSAAPGVDTPLHLLRLAPDFTQARDELAAINPGQ